MAKFGSIHFLNLIILYSTSLMSLSNVTSSVELATEVCRNTTNFNFCREVIYSDSRAPNADRYILAYIAFGRMYVNATDTKKYIASMLKTTDPESKSLYYALKKCQGYYKEAVQALFEVLTDLDSDTYYGFDKLSIDVAHCARDCEVSFRGQSPISRRNEDLIKLSNVCLAVAKLFPYH